MNGATNVWAIKVWLHPLVTQPQLGNSPRKVVALARVEMKPGAPQTGVGIQDGIYYVTNRKYIGSVKIPLKQMTNGKYYKIEFGHAKLDSGMYLWPAPINNPNVAAI